MWTYTIDYPFRYINNTMGWRCNRKGWRFNKDLQYGVGFVVWTALEWFFRKGAWSGGRNIICPRILCTFIIVKQAHSCRLACSKCKLPSPIACIQVDLHLWNNPTYPGVCSKCKLPSRIGYSLTCICETTPHIPGYVRNVSFPHPTYPGVCSKCKLP